jgi:hypothetical protein
MLRIGSCLLGCVLLTSAPSAAGVILVGPPGSGAPYNDIQPAIDAALPGDTIVVLPLALPATYSGFVLSKPLRVLGSGWIFGSTAYTFVIGSVDVQGIAAGTEAVVGGFDPLGGPLRITGNAGLVSVFDVDAGRLEIRQSARVLVCSSAFRDTTVRSATVWAADSSFMATNGTTWPFCGLPYLPPGAPGIELFDSTLYLARCSVRGGIGDACKIGIGGFEMQAPGGDGIRAHGSTLKLVGGPGNLIQVGAQPGTIPAPGPLPFALSIASGSVSLASGDTVLSGHPAQPAVQADDISHHYPVPTIYPTMRTSRPTLAPGINFDISANGTPDALLALFAAASSVPELLLAGIDGALALDPSVAGLFALVPLNPSGHGVKSFVVPADPGLVGTQMFLQGIEVGGPALAFSNPLIESVVP